MTSRLLTAVWPYYNNAKRSIDEQNYSSEHITCYVQKATELPNQLLDGYSLFFLEPLMNSALFWWPVYCVNETRHLHNWCDYWGMHSMPMLVRVFSRQSTVYKLERRVVKFCSVWLRFFFWFFGKGPCLVQKILHVPRTTTTTIKSSKCARNWLFYWLSTFLPRYFGDDGAEFIAWGEMC